MIKKPSCRPEFRFLADGRLVLEMPIPDRACSPNAQRGQSRGAAIRKSRVVKAHRTLAHLLTVSAMASGGRRTFGSYALAFYWPTAAWRDDDNADASCKAYRDGIAQALGMNDRDLRKGALSQHAKDAAAPRVTITLFPIP